MNKLFRKLTLIITLYKPTRNELNYWFTFYEKNIDSVHIQFLVDGTDIEFLPSINSEDIFKYEINQGRFKMVYDHITSGSVVTQYFKIVDPDDHISMKDLLKIDLPNLDSIVRFVGVNVDSKFEIDNNNEREALSSGTEIYSGSFGTPTTILPTKMIRDDKYYSGRNIYMIDDQLFGMIAYWNGADLHEIENSFYLYNPGIGELSNDDYFLKHIDNVLIEVNNIIKNKNLKVPNINWPKIMIPRLESLLKNDAIRLSKLKEIIEVIEKNKLS